MSSTEGRARSNSTSPLAQSLGKLSFFSLTAFVLSFFFVAYSIEGSNSHDMPGFLAFFWGPLAVIAGIPAWLANPIYIYGHFQLRRRQFRRAQIAGLFSSLFATSFLFHSKMPFGGGDSRAPYDVGIGYVLWLLSMLIFFGAATYHVRRTATSDA
jgi:hypothetical protein